MTKYPLNEEYLAQTESWFEKLPQEAVQLAMAVLLNKDRGIIQNTARSIIAKYADWNYIDELPGSSRRLLLLDIYGMAEVEAMKQAGEICCICCIQLVPPLTPLKDKIDPKYYRCEACYQDRYGDPV